MSISGIRSGQGVYNPNRPSQSQTRQMQREVVPENQQADKVNLSVGSKQVLEHAQGKKSGLLGAPDGRYPVEYYAMPTWMAGLFPVELSGQIGATVNETYAKGGHLIGQYDQERLEYGKRLDSHYQALMAKEGIDNPEKHYEALIANKDNSERLHQSMLNSISGDSRMKELMTILGINAI